MIDEKKVAEGVTFRPMSINLAIPRNYIHKLSAECERTGQTAGQILVYALDMYFASLGDKHITH